MIKVNSDNNSILTKNKDNPRYLPLLGFLKNTDDAVIYTDGNSSIAGIFDGVSCCFVGDNYPFLDEVISTLTTEVQFCGVSDEVISYLRQKYGQYEKWSMDSYLYVYNGEQLSDIPAERLLPLETKHWQSVSDGTAYKAERADIEDCVLNRPSSAIYIDGQPVCWCLLHRENSLGMLYTLPQYRRQGLALKVMKDITQKVIDSGDTPYCFIAVGNTASEQLASQYNLVRSVKSNWIGIDFMEAKCR